MVSRGAATNWTVKWALIFRCPLFIFGRPLFLFAPKLKSISHFWFLKIQKEETTCYLSTSFLPLLVPTFATPMWYPLSLHRIVKSTHSFVYPVFLSKQVYPLCSTVPTYSQIVPNLLYYTPAISSKSTVFRQ